MIRRNQMIPFIKMVSLGNDIIVLPVSQEITSEQIKTLAHRNNGIGADQILMLGNPLKIWNQDSSVAEACGNGTRCVIAYLSPAVEEKISIPGPVGPLVGWYEKNHEVSVQQGNAVIGLIKIKNAEYHTEEISLSSYGLSSGIPIYMGNAHLVIFAAPPDDLKWQTLVYHPSFPEGVNVSFVSRESFYVTVWERGVGPTLGCGSAACAVASVLFSQGVPSPVTLQMPGGKISVAKTSLGLVHTAQVTTIAHGWWQSPC